MMIGDTHDPRARRAREADDRQPVVLELAGLFADDDEGLPAIEAVNLKVQAGEIVGIAGVSGNGQSELVEVLSGQRALADGAHLHQRRALRAEPRGDCDSFKVFGLPEEPLQERRRAAR